MIPLVLLLAGLAAETHHPTRFSCERVPDLGALADLAEIEEEMDVPHDRRGILAAIWCVESRWSPPDREVLGDDGKAVGPMQLHWATSRPCARPDEPPDRRSELGWSARCWLKRVGDLLPRARARCGDERAWDVAQAMIASPYYRWWCGARTSHVRLLERWRSGEAR